MNRLFLLALVAGALACGGSSSGHEDIPPPTGPPVLRLPHLPKRLPPGDCKDVAGMHLLRTFPQSRGTEVDVVLHAEDGALLDPKLEYSACIASEGAAWRRDFEDSILLILVRPEPDADRRAASLEALGAFLDARPAGEQIAAALWADDVYPVDIPTTDRGRTLHRVERALDQADLDGIAAPETDSVPAAAVAMLAGFGGDSRASFRAVVSWGPSVSAPASFEGPSTFVVALPEGDDLNAAATTLSAALDADRASGFYGVGFCLAQETVSLEAGATKLRVELPELAWELERGPECNADYTALGGFPYAERMEFRFTEAERAQLKSLSENQDKTTFTSSLRWHESLPYASVVAHIRGQSSLKCARKNFSIDMRGDKARPLMPGMLSDEFYLVSMCLDEAYINQLTADRIMRDLGLFPLDFKLVEVLFDGESQGVYILLEKPSDQLRRALPTTLHSIIRRRTDIDDKPAEVDWARGDETEARASYDSIVGALDGLSGQDVVDQLDATIDSEAFFRWVALMTTFANGDYIDELLFYANDAWRSGSENGLYYSVLGWDPDDLFSACHHSGQFAIVDPRALLYCAEGVLEHRLFADPLLYGRYVDTLEEVQAKVTEEAFAASLDTTVEDLLPFFDKDEITAAMVELRKTHPEATTGAAAKKAIKDEAAAMKVDFKTQRDALVTRIAAYRAE